MENISLVSWGLNWLMDETLCKSRGGGREGGREGEIGSNPAFDVICSLNPFARPSLPPSPPPSFFLTVKEDGLLMNSINVHEIGHSYFGDSLVVRREGGREGGREGSRG